MLQLEGVILYLLKMETFFKIIFRASAERVQALPINLRYIYKRVFHKQTAPIYEHTTDIAPIHVATCSFVKNFVHSHLNGSVLFK